MGNFKNLFGAVGGPSFTPNSCFGYTLVAAHLSRDHVPLIGPINAFYSALDRHYTV
jgi:hypothetical protein